MALRAAIDYPDAVSGSTQVVAHTLESRSVEESGDGDETNDASVVLRVVVEDLPGRPAPEIDVEVAQVLGVGADAPIGGRYPFVEQWVHPFRRRTFLNPAAASLGLFLVGWIADHDRNRFLLFDLVGLLPRFGNLAVPCAQRFDLGIRAAERVGDEHARRRSRRFADQLNQFGIHP